MTETMCLEIKIFSSCRHLASLKGRKPSKDPQQPSAGARLYSTTRHNSLIMNKSTHLNCDILETSCRALLAKQALRSPAQKYLLG